jgi:chromosomal replication initiation ATPase DnaA
MKKNIFNTYADAVAQHFHITLDQMFSPSRRRDLVDARQLLYYICMERPIRLSYIQRFLSENGCEVTHSTIIHGYKKAKELIDSDPDYANIIERIEKSNVSV